MLIPARPPPPSAGLKASCLSITMFIFHLLCLFFSFSLSPLAPLPSLIRLSVPSRVLKVDSSFKVCGNLRDVGLLSLVLMRIEVDDELN